MVLERPVVTATDVSRLRNMVHAQRSVGDPFGSHLRELSEVMEHAELVAAANVAPDVVTMNSRVRVRDVQTGRQDTFTLVYHGESGMFDTRLSVLSPMGIAALGARVGSVIEFRFAAAFDDCGSKKCCTSRKRLGSFIFRTKERKELHHESSNCFGRPRDRHHGG